MTISHNSIQQLSQAVGILERAKDLVPLHSHPESPKQQYMRKAKFDEAIWLIREVMFNEADRG